MRALQSRSVHSRLGFHGNTVRRPGAEQFLYVCADLVCRGNTVFSDTDTELPEHCGELMLCRQIAADGSIVPGPRHHQNIWVCVDCPCSPQRDAQLPGPGPCGHLFVQYAKTPR